MSQTTYVTERAIGREGVRATAEKANVVTKWVDEATIGIKPGRVVTIGEDGVDGSISLPDALADISTFGKAVGITMLDETREPLTDGAYADNDPCPVMTQGVIWMLAEDAVNEGDPVFVRCVATGGEELGRVRSDADTTDAVELPTAKFGSSTTGTDELVKVIFNLP